MAYIDATGLTNDAYLALGDAGYTNFPLFDINSAYLSGFSWKRNKLYYKFDMTTFNGKKAEIKLNVFGDFPSDGPYMARSAYISGFDSSYEIKGKDVGKIKFRNMKRGK